MKASYKISLVIAAALLLFVIFYFAFQGGTSPSTQSPAGKRLARADRGESAGGGETRSGGSSDGVSSERQGGTGAGAQPSSQGKSDGGVSPKPDRDTLAFLHSRVNRGRGHEAGEGGSDMDTGSGRGAGAGAGRGSSSSSAAGGSGGSRSMPHELPPPGPDHASGDRSGNGLFNNLSGRDTSEPDQSRGRGRSGQNAGGGTGNGFADQGGAARGSSSPSGQGAGSDRRAPTGTPHVGPGRSSGSTGRAADQPRTYTIEPGDSFSSIARDHYGSVSDWKRIAQANPLVDPKHLKVGQEIRLPPQSKAEGAAGSSGSSNAAGSGGASGSGGGAADTATRYTVKPRDTLSSIARDYYGNPTRWRRIYKANRAKIGPRPSGLKAGMTLTIPPPPEAAP